MFLICAFDVADNNTTIEAIIVTVDVITSDTPTSPPSDKSSDEDELE